MTAPKESGTLPSAATRVCKSCGCTEAKACDGPLGPCSWATKDQLYHLGLVEPGVSLCSRCADLAALQKDSVRITITGFEAFTLLGIIQLACRHPELQEWPKEFAESFGGALAERISYSDHVAALCQQGWQPEFDVRSPESKVQSPKSEPAIITPDDPDFEMPMGEPPPGMEKAS